MPEPIEPVVVRIVREQREAVLRGEAEQARLMARRWLELERRLEGSIRALALEIQMSKLAGMPMRASQVYQMERYRLLLQQVKAEVEAFSRLAAGQISETQARLAAQAVIDGSEVIQTALREAGASTSLSAAFNILPTPAVQTMMGLAGDGSPLFELLKKSYGDATQGITNALVQGLAEGWGAEKLAKAMTEQMGGGFDRALRIARTESLRAYRESSRLSYAQSGVVKGYRRAAKHSPDVCSACILAEGTFYEIDAAFEEHPSGHCFLVPVIDGIPEAPWLHGEQWLLGQPPEVQKSILTPAYYQAWKNGDFELRDVVRRKTDATWGSYLHPAPLKELVH